MVLSVYLISDTKRNSLLSLMQINASISHVNNITVSRLCYPSGEGSQEVKTVAPTDETTAFLVPAFVHNCSVSVEAFQGDRVLALGHASFESKGFCICKHACV